MLKLEMDRYTELQEKFNEMARKFTKQKTNVHLPRWLLWVSRVYSRLSVFVIREWVE